MTYAMDTNLATLVEMLHTCRPAGSKTEKRFIREFIKAVPDMQQDAFGNLHIRIGTAPVLWSSHTDTVHYKAGVQTLAFNKKTGVIGLHADSTSSCLGADCTTGVWLMLEMIKAGKEGLYIFHREEETGGGGSSWIAKNNPDILKDIKFAIAFDRYGTTSVITHQFGERCCSEAFSESLSTGLGLGMTSDTGGSFTDTANYTNLIGECTNISVGYLNQHKHTETQNLYFADALLKALLALDLNTLVSQRKPGEIDPDGWMGRALRWRRRGSGKTIHELVREHPAVVADMLLEFGFAAQEIEEYRDNQWGGQYYER